LALLGIGLVLDRLDLRSGCELYTTSRKFELIHADGTRHEIPGSSMDALRSAIAVAEQFGLRFNASPVQLTAGPALAALVARGGSV